MGIDDRDYMRNTPRHRWPRWWVGWLALLGASALVVAWAASSFERPHRTRQPQSYSAQPDVLGASGPIVVNVNSATLDELDNLPYISRKVAQAIIDGRPYSKPEDLLRVRGIGMRTLERIGPHVRFE